MIAFGALVAAGIPLLLALTAVIATFGLVAVTSQAVPVATQAAAIVLLIGLAVGVDYSLFYLRREREERAPGRSEQAALEVAAATSGRAVLISGLTVMTAMAGMFLTGDKIFASFALATILVVAIAMLGSLTVLPALLSRLGDRVDRGRFRSSAAGAATTAKAGSGARSSTASCAGRWCRPSSPAGCWWPSRCRRSSCAWRSRAGHVPEVAAGGADLRPHAGGLPRHGSSGERGRRGAGRQRAGDAGGDRAARAAGPRERPHARADHRRRQRGGNGREHHRPDRGQGNRRRLERSSHRPA